MKKQIFLLLLMSILSIQSIYSIKNETPLMLAIASKNSTLAKELIHNGSAINAKDSNGDTALTRAVINQDQECAKLLLDHGADLFVENHNGKSPWIIALESNDDNFIHFLRTYQPPNKNPILSTSLYNHTTKSHT